jgi:hypothetical protein
MNFVTITLIVSAAIGLSVGMLARQMSTIVVLCFLFTFAMAMAVQMKSEPPGTVWTVETLAATALTIAGPYLAFCLAPSLVAAFMVVMLRGKFK